MKKLLAIFLILISLVGLSQSETHVFTTYDTLVNTLQGGAWNLRITRPSNMFTAGNADTASRPAIIFMVGSGEISNPSYMGLYGPHYWLANGWDGGVQLTNGTHYPIIITCQPYTTSSSSYSAGGILLHILSYYHIKANSVHLTGLSMGAIRWEMIMSAERTTGGGEYASRVTSICALSGSGNLYGQPDWLRGDPLPYRDSLIGDAASNWKGVKTWVKKYNGKYFALEGNSDGVQAYLWFGTQAMNDTLAGSAYFHYYNGGHCCWNTMYDPNQHQWGSSATNSFLVEPTPGGGIGPPTAGTYHAGSSLFEWMLRQGDTSLVGAGGGNTPPSVSAGSPQTITTPPTTSVSLTGTASDADGIATTTWTQVSGSGATITSPSSLSTTITGLNVSGVRIFRLTATDNLGASAYSDVTITVNAYAGSSSSETNNFITYDTTFTSTAGNWNIRISRPLNMFVAGNADTASRPAIIFMVGVGEACNCFDRLGLNGPHAIYNPNGGGWDGRIVMGNGTHYPIYISLQPHQQWPSTKASREIIEHLLNYYHIKRNSVHLTGLSMGAMTWTRMINSGTTADREASMKLVKSIAALQGQGNAYYAWRRDANNSAPLYQLGGDSVTTPETYADMYCEPLGSNPNPSSLAWKAYRIWAKKYGGRYFSLNGTADFAGVDNWLISEAMNDTLANTGYFAWENIGGGQHCCWNSMYDPNATNWTSVGTLGPGIVASGYNGHTNTMGNYKAGYGIFGWMLQQGDTSIVGSGNQSPLAFPGSNQTIIYPPNSSVTLSGSGSDADGTIASYAWSQVSGTAATITSASSASTTVTGMASPGVRTFRLTVTDNLGATGTGDVSITVNAPSPPSCNAGADQSITLPTSSVSLSGSATAGGGGSVITFAWTQLSGTTATITSPTSINTTITGLTTTGTRVFRLTVTDSIGSSVSDDISIVVNAASSGSDKTINVNLYANNDPYNNSEWNNQLITQASYPYTSGVYNWDYGAASTIYSTISASQGPTASTYADNGAGYNTTMCPSEVGRYASFVSAYRTVTFSGLDNAKLYDIKLYESRATAQGTTRNIIGSTTIDIAVQSNVSNVALFSNVAPSSGDIVLTQQYLNTYCYLNGFTIVEKGSGTGNTPPVANGGGNKTITLPTATTTLTGSGTDADGSITSYVWTQISGTAATITSTNTTPSGSEVTIAGLSTSGVRVFRLTVTDNGGATATDDVTVTVNPAVVTTGSLFVNITNSIPLNVTTTSASLTSSTTSTYGLASTKWTKLSVPGQGTKSMTIIGSSTAACNGVTDFDSCFVERFRAYGIANGVLSTITNLAQAGWTPDNQDITAALNYGSDILLCSFPSNGYTSTQNSYWLGRLQRFKDSTDARGKIFYITGTQPRNDFSPADRANLKIFNDSLRNRFGTRFIDFLTPLLDTTDNTIKTQYYFDGIHPNNSGHRIIYDKLRAANIFQTFASSASTITTPTTANTGITGLVTGKHKFQVAVTDIAGYAASAVDTVNANITNLPPTANAGTNQTITLPLSTVTLSGSGTDADGSIASYAWTQTLGNVAVITTPTTASTTITGLTVSGSYTFRLTVTDNSGATGTSDVVITVNTAPITSTTTILGPNSNLGTSGSPRTNFNPGDTILLRDSGSYFISPFYLQLRGTVAKPIVIMNSPLNGREVRIRSLTGVINLKNSQNVIITGTGLNGTQYGIAIDHSLGNSPDSFSHGGGGDGINISGRSKNIYITNVSIHNVDNGILVSQTPGCIDSLRYIDTLTSGNSLFPQFVQDSIKIWNNQIVGTGGNGIQVGFEYADNSSSSETNPYLQTIYNNPVVCSGDTTYPEPLRTGFVDIQYNSLDSTGKNGILSGAHDNFSDVLIKNNIIKHNGMNGDGANGYAVKTTTYQFPQIISNSIISTLSQAVGLFGSGHTSRITKIQNNYIDSSGHLNYYVNGWTSNDHTKQNPSGTANTLVNNITNMIIASRPVKYQRSCDSIMYSVTNNRFGANKSPLDAFHNGVSQLTKYFIEVQDFWQMFNTVTGSTISCNIGLDGSDIFRIITGSQYDTLVTIASSYPGQYLNNPWRNPAISPVYDTVCTASTAPTANAGNSQDIILPTTSVILTGSGTANNGGSIITYAWTQTSGTAATIVSASQPITQITGITTTGTRVFKLTVTQNDNQTASSSVTVTTTAVVNPGPIANSGTPQTIVLPTTSCTLTGSGIAGAGSITAYEWTQVSGTAATITSPTSATTTITALTTAGTRVFRLTVIQTDGQNNTSDVTVTVNAVLAAKLIPGRIEAESYDNVFGGLFVTTTTDTIGTQEVQGIMIGYYMDYDVTVNTTGVYKVKFRTASPQNFAKFNIQLGLLKLGTVNITNRGSWSTWGYDSCNISLTAGAQTLRVVSADPEQCNFNFMDFVLQANNQPPTAVAGADQTVYYPPTSIVNLNGSNSTDRDGQVVAYSWAQISGSAVTIQNNSSAITTLTGVTTAGTRGFTLTVQDNNGAVSAPDSIYIVTVANATPVACINPINPVILPVTTTTLNAACSSDDIAIVSYLWTQVSGIVATITSPTASSTTITGLNQVGARVFRLRVTDGQGLYAETDITVNVLSSTRTGADFILKGIKGN